MYLFLLSFLWKIVIPMFHVFPMFPWNAGRSSRCNPLVFASRSARSSTGGGDAKDPKDEQPEDRKGKSRWERVSERYEYIFEILWIWKVKSMCQRCQSMLDHESYPEQIWSELAKNGKSLAEQEKVKCLEEVFLTQRSSHQEPPRVFWRFFNA